MTENKTAEQWGALAKGREELLWAYGKRHDFASFQTQLTHLRHAIRMQVLAEYDIISHKLTTPHEQH